MKRITMIPTALLVTALIGVGAMTATAQSPDTQSQAKPMHEKTHYREGKGGKHGKHGGGMFGGREMFATLFTEVDANGDGAVTQEEIDTYRAGKVAQADTSGDGALSIEEFDTLYREFTRSRMVDRFQELDADGDGVISAAEMDARFGKIVERMDRDDDGALTLQPRGKRG